MERIRLTLTGIVQGVGFRPHVARLATAFPITGTVSNTDTAVLCEIQGEADAIHAFTHALLTNLPPLATVLTSATDHLPVIAGEEGFTVVDSQRVAGIRSLIPPDIATCPDCLREFHNPADRRYHYPFINCTNCGPRVSIIEDLPYDRPLTTMREFPMCPACAAEYNDPTNRRYHAEPTACPQCGPQLWAGDFTDQPLHDLDEVAAACRRWIEAGAIVAVKGLGGYHLVCDATNPEAVARLRARKHRPDKPFAVMVPSSAETAGRSAWDPVTPIVLTPADKVNHALTDHEFPPVAVESVAPRLDRIGIMTPYTPLHHLLLEAVGRPLVATSGNRSGEPLIYDDAEALDPRRGLGHLADYVIGHTRRIHLPVEDSVVLATPSDSAQSQPVYLPIRRSRGFAPVPVPLPDADQPANATGRTILAVGGEMKNTFALVEGTMAHVSAHVGEMGSWATQQAWETALQQMLAMRQVTPQLIVCDMHPNYASTALAEKLARRWGTEIIEVQHHHAHALALAAEHHLTAGPFPVATLDGTGYGLDGTIWGGEILVLGSSLTEFTRPWHLPPFHLTGGDRAVRHPDTIAANLLADWGLTGAPARTPANSMATTSLGRLFDAVAYLVGLVQTEATYEGQAAMELEALARTWAKSHPNRAKALPHHATSQDIVQSVLTYRDDPDLGAGGAAWIFHHEIGTLIGRELVKCATECSSTVIGLTGGSAINQLLVQAVRGSVEKLAPQLELLTHRSIPAGDGGLCLGQAYAGYLSGS